MRMLLAAAALTIAGAAAAQTQAPAPDSTTGAPASPATTAPAPTTTPQVTPSPADQALPRCSATVRDRCVQDERFARDTPNPGGSRDNNAMAYPSEAAAQAASRRGRTRLR